jgi:hypothetical protein
MSTQGYIDLQDNGRLFPSWVMLNYKKFRLDKVETKEGEDPCNKQQKDGVRKYQEFLSYFLSYKSPFKDILVYHI